MAVLSSTPRCSNKFTSVGDAISQLPAFDAIFESSANSCTMNNCDPNRAAEWAKAVYDEVLNCSGMPTELDFFEKAFNSMGRTKQVDATDLYIKYNCDVDYNQYAAAEAIGAGPGVATNFTILRSGHSGNGKYTNIHVGGELYIYEDHRWVVVTAVNTTVDYAHVATVVPKDANYTVHIRKGKKMLFQTVRFIDGYSCSVPTTTWMTPGYIKKISPMRLRKDWEQPMDLTRGYKDRLQFGILFDNEGKEVDGWLPYQQVKAREEFKYAKNLMCFLGERVTNAALVGTGLTLENDKYAGFDGYLPTMRFGGGTVYDYNTSVGLSLEADFMPVIKRQDALKRSKDFLILYGFDFMTGLVRNNGETFKASAGQNNLSVFKQMGADMDVIEKLKISQYSYMGYTFNFKAMDALSDTRSIGNYDMPYLGMAMPLSGVRDSSGNAVNAIEFFQPYGTESGTYWESGVRDHRYLQDGCEKWSGSITETMMMAVHCPQLHILFNGVVPCA